MSQETQSQQHEQRPQSPPAPRGRPFVKGQSGNPAGRPPRKRQVAAVAEYLIGRKTIVLTEKLIDLALAGDKTALRMCLDRIAPPRREPPAWLPLPPVEHRSDARAAMAAVVDAAAAGAITSAQAAALARMLDMIYLHL
jgi:hypothetical protein